MTVIRSLQFFKFSQNYSRSSDCSMPPLIPTIAIGLLAKRTSGENPPPPPPEAECVTSLSSAVGSQPFLISSAPLSARPASASGCDANDDPAACVAAAGPLQNRRMSLARSTDRYFAISPKDG